MARRVVVCEVKKTYISVKNINIIASLSALTEPIVPYIMLKEGGLSRAENEKKTFFFRDDISATIQS